MTGLDELPEANLLTILKSARSMPAAELGSRMAHSQNLHSYSLHDIWHLAEITASERICSIVPINDSRYNQCVQAFKPV